MELILEFDDSIADRIIDGFSKHHGYVEIISSLLGDEGPNPESKQDFLTRKLVEFIQGSVLAYEVNVAVKEAQERVSVNKPDIGVKKPKEEVEVSEVIGG